MAQQKNIIHYFSRIARRRDDIPDTSCPTSPKKRRLHQDPESSNVSSVVEATPAEYLNSAVSSSSVTRRRSEDLEEISASTSRDDTSRDKESTSDAPQQVPSNKPRFGQKLTASELPSHEFEESDPDDDGLIPLPSKTPAYPVSSDNTLTPMSSQRNTRHGKFEKVPEVKMIESKFHPNKSFVFPKQTTGASRNRSVQHKWFQQFSWLHYNREDDSLLCFACVTATSMVGKADTSWYTDAEMAFLVVGFRNWKDALSRFAYHEKSVFHRKSVDLILKRTTAVPIHAQLNQALVKEQKDARVCLQAIISSTRFLALSGNAIRGHEHQEGNLRELLDERKEDIPELEHWLKKRNNYLSSDMQNEYLQTMANAVLRDIIADIKLSPYFAVIADGTTDISGKEQFSICIRSVHPDSLIVRELFVGLYNPDDSQGCTLAAAIKDVLLRMTLPLSDLRGFCFDGAPNMSGRHKGVQQILNKEQPKSVYVHCANHSADLALQEVARQRNGVCDLLCLVKDSSNIILESAKRKKMFENVVLPACSTSDGAESANPRHLVALCPTRWSVRVKSLVRYKNEYLRVQGVLEEIVSDRCGPSDEKKSAIRGWLKRLSKFETLFYLNVSIELFTPCEDLARALQSPRKTATGARRSVDILVETLGKMRCAEFFEDLFSRSTEEAEKMGLHPLRELRRKVPPLRYEQKVNTAAAAELDSKTALRKELFEILDLLISELKYRFDQDGLQSLVNLEELVLDALKGIVPPVTEVRRKLGPFAEDFDENLLKSELQHLNGIFSNVPMSTSALATALAKECATVRTMLQEVVKLVTLLMTIPASAASAERSFSALRRLKTYLRSTMTQKRLTNVMLLHVHKELTCNLNLVEIMREFVSRSEDRKRIFGKV